MPAIIIYFMSDHKKKLKSAEYVVQISDGVMHGLVSYFATDTSSRQQKSKAYPPFLSLFSALASFSVSL